mmetsp:Transcript_80905/g.168885  ORF Transcript_80905/g.168885 Transcript_80905/m.168885 type:complete len:490 (+) Transcript_80905:1154-2623(+)
MAGLVLCAAAAEVGAHRHARVQVLGELGAHGVVAVGVEWCPLHWIVGERVLVHVQLVAQALQLHLSFLLQLHFLLLLHLLLALSLAVLLLAARHELVDEFCAVLSLAGGESEWHVFVQLLVLLFEADVVFRVQEVLRPLEDLVQVVGSRLRGGVHLVALQEEASVVGAGLAQVHGVGHALDSRLGVLLHELPEVRQALGLVLLEDVHDILQFVRISVLGSLVVSHSHDGLHEGLEIGLASNRQRCDGLLRHSDVGADGVLLVEVQEDLVVLELPSLPDRLGLAGLQEVVATPCNELVRDVVVVDHGLCSGPGIEHHQGHFDILVVAQESAAIEQSRGAREVACHHVPDVVLVARMSLRLEDVLALPEVLVHGSLPQTGLDSVVRHDFRSVREDHVAADRTRKSDESLHRVVHVQGEVGDLLGAHGDLRQHELSQHHHDHGLIFQNVRWDLGSHQVLALRGRQVRHLAFQMFVDDLKQALAHAGLELSQR